MAANPLPIPRIVPATVTTWETMDEILERFTSQADALIERAGFGKELDAAAHELSTLNIYGQQWLLDQTVPAFGLTKEQTYDAVSCGDIVYRLDEEGYVVARFGEATKALPIHKDALPPVD